jgi:CRP-like cAMP-binding protein
MGDLVDHSCMVLDGLTARFDQTLDGRRQITSFYMAGDMPDLHSLVLPRANSWLESLTTASIISVPHAALHKAISGNPAIALAFWRDCSVDAAVAAEWIVNVGQRGAPERAAHLFCEMALRSGKAKDNSFQFPFPVTQEQLGEAMGLSAVHVNRTLADLRGRELLLHAGKIASVLDWHGLIAAAGFDQRYLNLGKVH